MSTNEAVSSNSLTYVYPQVCQVFTVSCSCPGGLRCTIWSTILVDGSAIAMPVIVDDPQM